ncbi:MAG: hypothetical protein IT285_01530 [Bdellovibrionales bacterium]|nr:hypothetical protein [Bdellovibrionales bacterium]
MATANSSRRATWVVLVMMLSWLAGWMVWRAHYAVGHGGLEPWSRELEWAWVSFLYAQLGFVAVYLPIMAILRVALPTKGSQMWGYALLSLGLSFPHAQLTIAFLRDTGLQLTSEGARGLLAAHVLTSLIFGLGWGKVNR